MIPLCRILIAHALTVGFVQPAPTALHAPLLVIHSDSNQVNPLDGAREIFAAAPPPKALAILHGYSHNAIYQRPSEQ